MEATSLRERNRSSFAPLLILAALVLASIPELAFAQSAPWESAAQNTYNLIMSIVRWVAMIGVVGCGVAALFGKLSWDWAGKIIIGLVLIFGATQLVDYFRAGFGG